MAQFGRPSADTNNDGAWVEDDDSSIDIYLEIDEVSASDADFIKTPTAPSADPYVTKLTTLEDPISAANHTFRYRYQKDAASGSQIDLTVELRQGYVNEGTQGTLIKAVSVTDIGSSWTTGTTTLSAGEANSITDYTDLYLRFVGNQV